MNRARPPSSTDKAELRPEEERALVERAKSDREAFARLYDYYVDRVYQYVYYRVGNHEDAEDLTARVFYRMLRAIPRYRDTGAPFGAWVFRIAHNLVANWHRDQSRRRLLPLDEIPFVERHVAIEDEVLDEGIEREEAMRLVGELLRALPEDRQLLLFLKFREGMSNADIGRILGRTEGAVKALYNRTLQALRKELRKRQGRS